MNNRIQDKKYRSVVNTSTYNVMLMTHDHACKYKNRFSSPFIRGQHNAKDLLVRLNYWKSTQKVLTIFVVHKSGLFYSVQVVMGQ